MPDIHFVPHTPIIKIGRPTPYKGARFRSSVEARWAAMFDLLGWDWEYEVVDLNMYIPDFLLRLSKEVIVEVKSDRTLDELRTHTFKIEYSGYAGHALLLGGLLFKQGGNADLGLSFSIPRPREASDPLWVWSSTPLQRCRLCQKYSLDSVRAEGCQGPDHICDPVPYEDLKLLWREAGNIIQYKHRKVHYTPPLPGAAAEGVEDDDIPAMPEFETEAEARAWFEAGLDDGTTCPTCFRAAKRYNRKLNSGEACALFTIYREGRENPDRWVNITTGELPGLTRFTEKVRLDLQHWEYAKLRFWNLTEERPNTDPNRDRSGSGVWRLTDKGVDFINGRISVPRYVSVYDNIARGFSADKTDIASAYGDYFNFEELMSAPAHPCKEGLREMKAKERKDRKDRKEKAKADQREAKAKERKDRKDQAEAAKAAAKAAKAVAKKTAPTAPTVVAPHEVEVTPPPAEHAKTIFDLAAGLPQGA